jgi:hypothetical protein
MLTGLLFWLLEACLASKLKKIKCTYPHHLIILAGSLHQDVILPLLPISNLIILSLITYLIRLIDGFLFLFLIDGYLFLYLIDGYLFLYLINSYLFDH